MKRAEDVNARLESGRGRSITSWLVLIVVTVACVTVAALFGSIFEEFYGTMAARLALVGVFVLYLGWPLLKKLSTKLIGRPFFFALVYLVALGLVVADLAINHHAELHGYAGETQTTVRSAQQHGVSSQEIDVYRQYRGLSEDDRENVRFFIADMTVGTPEILASMHASYASALNDTRAVIALRMMSFGWTLCSPALYQRSTEILVKGHPARKLLQ